MYHYIKFPNELALTRHQMILLRRSTKNHPVIALNLTWVYK